MKATTLISFIDNTLNAYHYPIIEAISSQVGISGMTIKEARDYFYGGECLSMYQVIITSINKEDRAFYGSIQ